MSGESALYRDSFTLYQNAINADKSVEVQYTGAPWLYVMTSGDDF
jgi:hypothetical protein